MWGGGGGGAEINSKCAYRGVDDYSKCANGGSVLIEMRWVGGPTRSGVFRMWGGGGGGVHIKSHFISEINYCTCLYQAYTSAKPRMSWAIID